MMSEFLVNFEDFTIVFGLRYHLCESESESVCVFRVGFWTGGMMILLLYQYCNKKIEFGHVHQDQKLRLRANPS